MDSEFPDAASAADDDFASLSLTDRLVHKVN